VLPREGITRTRVTGLVVGCHEWVTAGGGCSVGRAGSQGAQIGRIMAA
jgi:hypothetical protein